MALTLSRREPKPRTTNGHNDHVGTSTNADADADGSAAKARPADAIDECVALPGSEAGAVR